MGPRCFVESCSVNQKSAKQEGKSLFIYTHFEDFYEEWCFFSTGEFMVKSDHGRICSDHFRREDLWYCDDEERWKVRLNRGPTKGGCALWRMITRSLTDLEVDKTTGSYFFNDANWELVNHLKWLAMPILGAGLVFATKYLVYWNRVLKAADFGFDVLTSLSISGNVARENTSFQSPDFLSSEARTSSKDYTKTGYHRGHLVPAGNFNRSAALKRETYRTTNICHMDPYVNTVINLGLEKKCREIAKQKTTLLVASIAGNLFKSEDGSPVIIKQLGKNEVSVPTHIYKIFLEVRTDRTLHVHSFMFKNEEPPPEKIPLPETALQKDFYELRKICTYPFFEEFRPFIASINGKAQVAQKVPDDKWANLEKCATQTGKLPRGTR